MRLARRRCHEVCRQTRLALSWDLRADGSEPARADHRHLREMTQAPDPNRAGVRDQSLDD